MATKKYLSLERLSEYDELIKGEISTGDSSTLASAKSYADGLASGKSDKGHTHDDRYYTEDEIDSKLSNITNGNVVVKESEHATSADNATTSLDAEKLGGQLPSYYAKASDIPTGALADKDSVSESDLDSALAGKINTAAEGNHSHSNKSVIDGITSTKVSNWDNAEGNAKSYTDEKIGLLMNNSSEAVDSIMELAEAMENNADAIEALEGIAASKVPTSRKINGKDLTADITLSATDVGADATGSASAVQSNLDSHAGDTTKHITSTERTNWNAAKTHADSAHAPSNAQANVIESIKVNGTAQAITSKSVNITVPTKASDIDAAPTSHKHEIADVNNLQSTLTNAANAISANTDSINTHTNRIVALETKVGDGFEEITSAEIQSLFK